VNEEHVQSGIEVVKETKASNSSKDKSFPGAETNFSKKLNISNQNQVWEFE
jgi:hypothetical protein